MGNLVLRIVGISTYNGVSRNGTPYVLKTLECDFNGEKVKIKTFDINVGIGDFAQISIGIKKSVYGSELVPVLEKIIPKNEIDK